MSAPKSWEKHPVRNTVVRLKRLGGQRIEIVMSDRSKELQNKLLKTIGETKYADQVERNRYGNLVCHLIVRGKMSFEKLVQKVTNLFVRCIERYEKKVASRSQTSASQGKTRRTKKYRNDPALATT